MNNKPVVIIGAGPAGLTAAYEFIKMGIGPIVLEKADKVGGIARTESYKGYYFDMGGHRFFTKIEMVNRLWQEMLGDDLLKVSRMSRIYYRGRFFHYPLELLNALFNLGLIESILIPLSYLGAQIRPYPKEETFEQWVSNRFGRRLYRTFFKTYTEKVWGIPCGEIKADWAAQRIKGLSLIAAVVNSLLDTQKAKTLINEFEYPLRGPGMMWQRFKEVVEAEGGQVWLNTEMTGLRLKNGSIVSVDYIKDDKTIELPVGHLISTMPINRLASMLKPNAPDKVVGAANKLSYRSFIIVILIVDKKDLFPDQWIYIHSPDVRVGRVQNFKNWSEAMVPDLNKTSIGMEYFCNEGDNIWSMTDADLKETASRELSQLGLADLNDIIDGYVVRQPNAYPIYDDAYKDNLKIIRDYLGGIDNLQTIGRNGLHRYNNMDHSMLTGILAVQNYCGANHDLWDVNEEEEYLEEDKKAIDRRLILENILGRTFASMDKLAFATAVGSVSGLLIFLATIWLVIKGGPLVGPNLMLLSQYFVGYTVTVKGALIAFGYSFVWGFLFGWLFAYLRNLSFGIYLYWVRKKTELLTLKDFFDYL
ncbi:NAD(P)/FAD-dependent oxidoreductase [Thermodesulfobacteriota bacterium]